MLNNLEIDYFRGLESVKVPLRPLTILIGKNDTGKSSFLAAISLVANGRDIPSDDRFRQEGSLLTQIKGEVQGDGTAFVTSRQRKSISESIRPANLYQLPAHGVSMLSNGYSDQSGPQQLGPDGSGVPS